MESVELDGKSASLFDITPFRYVGPDPERPDERPELLYGANLKDDGYCNYYTVTWKNNVLPSSVKAGNQSLTLNVKYTCGATGKINIKLPVGDPALNAQMFPGIAWGDPDTIPGGE